MSEERTFTEEELKKILVDFAEMVDDLYRPYTRDNIHASESVESYLENIDGVLNPVEKVEEKTIGFTFGHLKMAIRWEYLHDIIGVDYYAQREHSFDENEVFEIKESVAREYNLIK